MHIALVTNEYPPEPHGGIGSATQVLAARFVASGHEVTVIGFGHEPSRIDSDGVRVIRLPLNQHGPMRGSRLRIRLHAALLRLHREQPVDVVEVPDFEGMLPMQLEECTTVVRLHHAQSLLRPRERATIGPFEEMTLRTHRHWITPSTIMAERTCQGFDLSPDSIEVIPPPAVLEPEDAQRSFACTLPGKFILVSGALTPEKGADRLPHLVPGWLELDPELYVLHVGPRDNKALDRITAACGSAHGHRFDSLGWLPRPQFQWVMQRAGALVMLSRREAFGITVAEAALSGCPVICPKVPPFSHFYEENEIAWVDPELPEGAIRRHLEELLAQPEFGILQATRAAEQVRRHCAPQVVADRTLEFYLSTIQRSNRST